MRLTVFLCGFLCWLTHSVFAQESRYTFDLSPFYGSILLHNTDISHLISAHPYGLILGVNRETYGDEEWESIFGYPDTGFSVILQDMKSETLGANYGLYAHYNFYFFKRNLQFRVGQGISYNTNPYDKADNFRNNAYGSHLLSSTYLMFQYRRKRVWDRLGLQAGITLVHYSNANVKAPNTSTNTFGLTMGLTYDLSESDREYVIAPRQDLPLEGVKLNLTFRTGINESDVINSGQFPFYILSAYADKRLGRLSAVQLGTELFHSNFLKELIRFQAISFPERNIDANTDFKRAGVFIGHELFINKVSVLTQLGYYVYYPYDFEGRVYNRVGLKRYFGDQWFAALSLKSHGAKAEALELGIGIRL